MLCREYDQKLCEKYKGPKDVKLAFHTRKEFLAYLKKNRKEFYGFYEK
jgi:hypothetical protein